jgi:hypothetical protein
VSPALRRVTYGALGGLWLSGALWWGLERFGARPGPFGEEPHPWLPALLEGHGGLAMAGLLVLGAVWVLHVRRGWRARRNRRSGGALVAFLGILILTGWALYYVADERAPRRRSCTSTAASGCPRPWHSMSSADVGSLAEEEEHRAYPRSGAGNALQPALLPSKPCRFDTVARPPAWTRRTAAASSAAGPSFRR